VNLLGTLSGASMVTMVYEQEIMDIINDNIEGKVLAFRFGIVE